VTATPYPRLTAAIEQRRTLLDRERDLTSPEFKQKPRPEQRRLEHQLAALDRETDNAARNAYATELLPALLNGQWQSTQGWSLLEYQGCLPLFDHASVFRLRGRRAPNSWTICAVVAHPYARPEPNIPVWPGVTVWTRPDLSSWYPNSTWLVVAARGLADRDPAQFGFTAVTPPKKTVPQG
jgi:hypothetical protein